MKVDRRGVEPVFVDRTGRRRRVFVAVGGAAGAALALATAGLLAGFTGAGPGRLPGLPGSGADQVRDAVTRPTPAATRSPVPSPPGSTGARAAGGGGVEVTQPAEPSGSAALTAGPTSRRTIPTHTPSHPGKPK